ILRSSGAQDGDGITLPSNREASSDEQLLKLWLHGRSPNTQRAYGSDVSRFRSFVGKSLHAVTLGDLQDFADSLTDGARAGEQVSRPVEREVAPGLRSSPRLPRLRRWKAAPFAGKQKPFSRAHSRSEEHT